MDNSGCVCGTEDLTVISRIFRYTLLNQEWNGLTVNVLKTDNWLLNEEQLIVI